MLLTEQVGGKEEEGRREEQEARGIGDGEKRKVGKVGGKLRLARVVMH
jgi:hypothetical protein